MIGNSVVRLATSAAVKVPSRSMSGIGVAGPPQNRIGFPLKLAYGGAMIGGACFYPFWVLVHLKDYKGKE
ncbi:uncharacterized protein LOC123301643 [Chrysoperla carnea]|uniref:uncharacterized protein LOC123301643 n=1 Tax=Chrysoperla carnea TaxID=189513 RepID=UPI001D0705B1|nr:uncharacterized protein LOC123301643 [Chrysoperla carnea]